MSSTTAVKLRVRGGVTFTVEKDVLLRVKDTYFYGLFRENGFWQPDDFGEYFIDISPEGFQNILDYLDTGVLSVKELSETAEQIVYENLDYLLIPFKEHLHYKTMTKIEGFKAWCVCQLKDGRLCGASNNNILVWNSDTCSVDVTMTGHTAHICELIQLSDGRICTCSNDKMVKLFNISSGVCELTLNGHTGSVTNLIQLFDGRICSSGWYDAIRVWNIATGVCEVSIDVQKIGSFVQLHNGKLCIGYSDGDMCIWNLVTRGKENSWKGHSSWVSGVIRIDSSSICSCSHDGSIKIWNSVTNECERFLQCGSESSLSSLILMQDGRLSTASWDGTVKVVNLSTGETESTVECGEARMQGLQLQDGRLLTVDYCSCVGIIS